MSNPSNPSDDARRAFYEEWARELLSITPSSESILEGKRMARRALRRIRGCKRQARLVNVYDVAERHGWDGGKLLDYFQRRGLPFEMRQAWRPQAGRYYRVAHVDEATAEAIIAEVREQRGAQPPPDGYAEIGELAAQIAPSAEVVEICRDKLRRWTYQDKSKRTYRQLERVDYRGRIYVDERQARRLVAEWQQGKR